MADLRNVVSLTKQQYETLYTNGTITVSGITITYSENDIYLIPDEGVNSVNGKTGDVIGIEETINKVTSLSNSSTHTQYPSAKCVYDLIGNVNTLLISLNSGNGV